MFNLLCVQRFSADGKLFRLLASLSNKTSLAHLEPKISGLSITDTTTQSLNLSFLVAFTNPTLYHATIPYIDIHILNNGTHLGNAFARHLSLKPGHNSNLAVHAVWHPANRLHGREVMSRYISDFNLTLEVHTHKSTFPSLPALGQALSHILVHIPAPRLHHPDPDRPPDSDSDSEATFITDAVLHLFTSEATFTLLSPLERTLVVVESVNATALYNHTHPVGVIDYAIPFKVGPGKTASPRIPVAWNVGGVGYRAVRDAVGGVLHVDAYADVRLRVGRWTELLWVKGRGIGASVRLL